MLKLIVVALIIFSLLLIWKFFIKNRAQPLLRHQPSHRQQSVQRDQIQLTEYHLTLELDNAEDQRHFDAVAALFFDQKTQNKNIEQAEQIQTQFLNKMPANTQSQINQFDLGEWGIYWSFQDQSLEYYVGRYGIFYTHIDQLGTEHKLEFRYR